MDVLYAIQTLSLQKQVLRQSVCVAGRGEGCRRKEDNKHYTGKEVGDDVWRLTAITGRPDNYQSWFRVACSWPEASSHMYVVKMLIGKQRLQRAADGPTPPKSQMHIVWRCMPSMLIGWSDFLFCFEYNGQNSLIPTSVRSLEKGKGFMLLFKPLRLLFELSIKRLSN